MKIIGAGLSGLIAAHAFPQAHVYERDGLRSNHKALLRFRSDAISRITNIPFRKVRVRKGIFDIGTNEFIGPNIRSANDYSFKTIGEYRDRSIWNMADCDRFIAPETFYEQLVAHIEHRLHLNTPIDIEQHSEWELISTIPLSAHQELLGLHDHFSRAKIYVNRFRVVNADVYQTVYFPKPDFPVYRASMTGDLFIMESTEHLGEAIVPYASIMSRVFGLPIADAEHLGETSQAFGKIAPIDETIRRQMITRLTREFGIYSLGRFATWRNILLDDLVKDIDVIKQLISTDSYGKAIINGTSSNGRPSS